MMLKRPLKMSLKRNSRPQIARFNDTLGGIYDAHYDANLSPARSFEGRFYLYKNRVKSACRDSF